MTEELMHRSNLKLSAAELFRNGLADDFDALSTHAQWLVQFGYEAGTVTSVIDTALENEAKRADYET